jgi:hypothetical protein
MLENANQNGRGVWEDGMATAESALDFPVVGFGLHAHRTAAPAAPGRLS